MTTTWSTQEEQTLRAVFPQTKTWGEVARVLARTCGVVRSPLAVERKCRRMGLYRRALKRPVLTVKQAASYFGPSVFRFYEWMKNSWLDFIITVSGKKRQVIRLTPEAVITFFRNPDHWFRWRLSEIKPLDLRAELTQLQKSAQWVWLSVRELAQREHVTIGTIERRIRDGWYPSAIKPNGPLGHWFIKSTDLERK